jgi:hypothetical protein
MTVGGKWPSRSKWKGMPLKSAEKCSVHLGRKSMLTLGNQGGKHTCTTTLWRLEALDVLGCLEQGALRNNYSLKNINDATRTAIVHHTLLMPPRRNGSTPEGRSHISTTSQEYDDWTASCMIADVQGPQPVCYSQNDKMFKNYCEQSTFNTALSVCLKDCKQDRHRAAAD